MEARGALFRGSASCSLSGFGRLQDERGMGDGNDPGRMLLLLPSMEEPSPVSSWLVLSTEELKRESRSPSGLGLHKLGEGLTAPLPHRPSSRKPLSVRSHELTESASLSVLRLSQPLLHTTEHLPLVEVKQGESKNTSSPSLLSDFNRTCTPEGGCDPA